MKFISPSYEILPLPDANDKMGVLKHLEKIGRISYKSEDKIMDDSCIQFIKKIRNRKHWAVLEHYIFVLSINKEIYRDFMDFQRFVRKENPDINEKIRYIRVTEWEYSPRDGYRYLLSGSATSFNYIWECFKNPKFVPMGIIKLLMFMKYRFDELMNPPYTLWEQEEMETTFQSLRYTREIRCLTRDEIKQLPPELRLIHDSISVKYTVNRGVTHEFVRHRPCSWLQESTRYVNYGKDKFQFILPLWLSESDKEILTKDEIINNLLEYPMTSDSINGCKLSNKALNWFLAMKSSSKVYENLINDFDKEKAWSPQQARDVLPHATKADIVQTCSLYEMRHFFAMRVPKSAHPQAREVTVPLLAELSERDPEIFKEQGKELLADI